jgi:hypothetical protein
MLAKALERFSSTTSATVGGRHAKEGVTALSGSSGVRGENKLHDEQSKMRKVQMQQRISF